MSSPRSPTPDYKAGNAASAYGGHHFTLHGVPIGIFSILLALLASMGGFIFGYDTGQISDILLMDDFVSRFGDHNGETGAFAFTNVRSGLIVGLLSIGTLIGALLGAPIADLLGRRYAMTVECIVFSIGVVVQMATVTHWYQFAIGRLIAGLGVGALSAAVPMYQAETAPPQIRGTLTGTYQLFITFGILVAYVISIGTRNVAGAGSWRTVVGISFVWAFILGVGILFMPESPRWSVRHGRPEAARLAIAKVRAVPVDHPIVDMEFEEILAALEAEEGLQKDQLYEGEVRRVHDTGARGLRGWLECFKGYGRGSSRIGYRTILGMCLQSLQQLTGANYFFYYGATIFQSVGLKDSYVTQIILGAVNFFCTFGGLYIMERYGRRVPLILGGIWQSIWLFIFAAVGTAKNPTTDPGIGKLMIVSACMFIWGYAMTWAPGIWILIGETFPTRTRAKQAALATASNWVWNFLLAFFTPFIATAIEFRYGFVFAACNMLGAVVVWMFLYESAGLSLENVDIMYRDPSVRPWSSSTWAPPGYASRTDALEERKQRTVVDSEKGANADGMTGAGTALGAEEVRAEHAKN